MAQNIAIDEELWFDQDLGDQANAAAAASFAAKLTQAQGLKTFPVVAQKILAIFSNDNYRVVEVTQALQEDPSLASNILRMANSAFFSPRSPITQINQAFIRIGAQHIKEIVCAVATMDLFQDIGGIGMHIRDHCAAVAGLAHYLARECASAQLEGLFLAGLLHDVGKLMLIESNEIDYPVDDSQLTLSPDTMHEYERKRLGYDHAVLGAHIISSWNFGATVSKTVAWHHQPARAYQDATIGPKVALLRLADHMDFCMRSQSDVEKTEKDIQVIVDSVEADILQIKKKTFQDLWMELYRVRNDALSTFK